MCNKVDFPSCSSGHSFTGSSICTKRWIKSGKDLILVDRWKWLATEWYAPGVYLRACGNWWNHELFQSQSRMRRSTIAHESIIDYFSLLWNQFPIIHSSIAYLRWNVTAMKSIARADCRDEKLKQVDCRNDSLHTNSQLPTISRHTLITLLLQTPRAFVLRCICIH